MKYILFLLCSWAVVAQQTVNNFTVKTNLAVGNNLSVTNEAVVDGINIGKGAGNAAGTMRVGKGALNGSATGTGNTAVGEQAGMSLTSGISNTLIGNNAGPYLTSSGNNVAIGKDSLFYATFGDTVPGTFGYTNGAHNNIVLGVNAAYNLIKGRNNFAAGTFSGFNLTNGSFNVLLGTHSGNDLIEGDGNTAIGESSLYKNTRGFYNTALGTGAGFYSSSNSERNVYLGFNSGPSSLTTENNKLYIDNAPGVPLIGGDFLANTVTISGRLGLGVDPIPTHAIYTKNLGGIIVEHPSNQDGSIAYLASGAAYSAFGYNGGGSTNAYGAPPASVYIGTPQQKDVWISSAGGRLKVSTPNGTTTWITVTTLPTSATGLPSGTLWNDSGTLKVAP